MGVEAYNYSTVIMFYLFLITSFIVPHAKGENYIVGDSYGWIDFVDFNNWCDGKEFHVGDVLGKGRVSHFIVRNMTNILFHMLLYYHSFYFYFYQRFLFVNMFLVTFRT